MIAAEVKNIEKRFLWFNNIPSDWNLVRLKNICISKLQYGINIPANKYSDNGVRFLRTTDINEDGEVVSDGIYIPKKEVPENYILQKGDLLFSRSGTIGRCYLHDSDEEYCYAGFLVKFKPQNLLLSKWLYYSSLTKEFKYQIFSEAIESTISNFNGNKYAVLRVAFPKSENELQKIIFFLDNKCAEVKRFIQTKQRFIELLKEQRQSIITNAVTKGIDENVQMKETGIDWIPNIPENWSARRLRFLVKITTGKKNTEDRIADGEYPFYVRSQTIERINSYSFEGEGILTAGDGVGVGKVFHYVNGKFDFHQRVYLFYDIDKEIEGEFLFNYLQANMMSELMRYNSKSTVDSIRLPVIKNFLIVFPERQEQKRILEHIKSETKTLDIAISKAEREIELIKEYREAMIAEAVTGKMKL